MSILSKCEAELKKHEKDIAASGQKVYLFATDSIFVPSIKILFPEISPREYKSFDTSASVFFEHCAKCREINRANVAWSGTGLPSGRYMKLISLRHAVSIYRLE